jgi:hypothetical protein
VFADRIEEDEICVIDGMRVTTPARTALDLASRYPTGIAVAAIDALAQATDLKIADIELLMQRYRGRRGIRSARTAVDLVDGGAQSPKETWLRLLLIRAGFPRPQTQIPVRDEFGRIIAYLDLDGTTSWSPLSTTATSTALTAGSTLRTFDAGNSSKSWGGSLCEWSPRIIPNRSLSACATRAPAERNVTVENRLKSRHGVTVGAKTRRR